MNHSPFWPLVWKEYRAGRAFWLSMAAMGLLLQGGVWWLARPSHDRDAWLYQIALMISAGFAVGIGGTLFAAENEEKTIALLRRLPIRPQALGAAKLFTAAAGLGTLLVILWLAARTLTGGGMLVPREVTTLWTTWGLACVEGLAWGILGSLLIPRPLWATLLAALTIVLVNAGLGWPDHVPGSMMEYGRSTLFRTMLLVVVVLADAMLLPGWLLGRDVARRQHRARAETSLWRRSVRHLAWQTVQEGKLSFLVLVGVGLLALAVNYSAYVRSQNFEPIAVILVMLAAADGTLVFRADQSHGPRFLAERGASPRTIWCSRQLVWGAWLWLLLAMIILVSSTVGIPSSSAFSPEGVCDAANSVQFDFGIATHWLNSIDRLPGYSYPTEPLVSFWSAWLVLLTAYAAGQLASLFLRRTLLSVTLGVFLGGLALAWFVLMQWIRAAYWWSVLPLPIGFLLATYLRMPAWLIERGGWRGWLLPVVAAAAPVAALSAAVPAYRVWQIYPTPALSAPESPPAAMAEAQTTLNLYLQAYERWQIDPPLAESNAQSGEAAGPHDDVAARATPALDLALEASRREQSLLVLRVATRYAASRTIEKMTGLLIELARTKRMAGNFDAAFETYLAALRADMQRYQCNPAGASLRPEILEGLQIWGAGAGQTVERIQGAIDRLEAWHAALPAPADLVLPLYQEDELTIDDLPAAAAAGLLDPKRIAWSHDGGRWSVGKIQELQWITSRLPWERKRAHRLLNWLAGFQIASADETAKDFAENRSTGMEAFGSVFGADMLVAARNSGLDPARLVWSPTTPLVEQSPLVRHSIAWLMVCQETDYRATLIILALEAWRIEHGSLPQQLDELVGHGLEKVPLDPLKAQRFGYGRGLAASDQPIGLNVSDGEAGPPPAAEAPPSHQPIDSDAAETSPSDRPVEPNVSEPPGRRFLLSALNPNGAERGSVVFGSEGRRALRLREGTLYFIPDPWEPKP